MMKALHGWPSDWTSEVEQMCEAIVLIAKHEDVKVNWKDDNAYIAFVPSRNRIEISRGGVIDTYHTVGGRYVQLNNATGKYEVIARRMYSTAIQLGVVMANMPPDRIEHYGGLEDIAYVLYMAMEIRAC